MDILRPSSGVYLGIAPHNDMPANGFCHSPFNLYHLIFHIRSLGTFSKLFPGVRQRALEHKWQQLLDPTPRLEEYSKFCELEEKGEIIK